MGTDRPWLVLDAKRRTNDFCAQTVSIHNYGRGIDAIPSVALMFKSYQFHSYYDFLNCREGYYWDIVDDDFTTKITGAECDSIMDAVILAYERRKLPVAANLCKFIAFTLRYYHKHTTASIYLYALANCKRHSALYKRYEEDIRRYLVLM